MSVSSSECVTTEAESGRNLAATSPQLAVLASLLDSFGRGVIDEDQFAQLLDHCFDIDLI